MNKEKVCHDLANSLVSVKYDKTALSRLSGHEPVLKTYIEIYRELLESYEDVIASVDSDEARQKESIAALIAAAEDKE